MNDTERQIADLTDLMIATLREASRHNVRGDVVAADRAYDYAQDLQYQIDKLIYERGFSECAFNQQGAMQ